MNSAKERGYITQTTISPPLPLPDTLPEVKALTAEMLPDSIRDYIFDVAERQQSAADFVAVTAICGLAAVLGRKALICPKQFDDWTVTPNQWGAIIGRPSAMKSPSMKEALKPLTQIEDIDSEQFVNNIKRYLAEKALADIEKDVVKKKAKQLAGSGNREGALQTLAQADFSDPPPTRKRLVVNDATVEKLAELFKENPNGLLLARDELSGWLARLAKEEYQGDRAFYLECFDGDASYKCDRIVRGTIEVKNCTLSIIGGIQPSKLIPLIRAAIRGTIDDGLVQRFQLAVWPNDIGNWKWKDRAPNINALKKYHNAFTQLHSLNFPTEDGEPRCFRFRDDAQKLFIEWMEEIQKNARNDDIHPALESHLLKMPQTIAGLALLFELIDGGRKAVGITATARALKWANYLKSHAERIYSISLNQGVEGARLILKRKNKLPNHFTARDVQRKCWSGLDSIEIVNDAIECLLDYHYLSSILISSNDRVGRPTTQYYFNPENINENN